MGENAFFTDTEMGTPVSSGSPDGYSVPSASEASAYPHANAGGDPSASTQAADRGSQDTGAGATPNPTLPTVSGLYRRSRPESIGLSPNAFVNIYEQKGNPFNKTTFTASDGKTFSFDPLGYSTNPFVASYEKHRLGQSELTQGTSDDSNRTASPYEKFVDSTSKSAMRNIYSKTGLSKVAETPEDKKEQNLLSQVSDKVGKYVSDPLLKGGPVGYIRKEVASELFSSPDTTPHSEGFKGLLEGVADGFLYAGGQRIGYDSKVRPSTFNDATSDSAYHVGNFLANRAAGLTFLGTDIGKTFSPPAAAISGALMSHVTDIPKYEYKNPVDPDAPPNMLWAGMAHGAGNAFNKLMGVDAYQAPTNAPPLLSKYGAGEILGASMAYASAPVVYPVRKLLVEPMQRLGQKIHEEN